MKAGEIFLRSVMIYIVYQCFLEVVLKFATYFHSTKEVFNA